MYFAETSGVVLKKISFQDVVQNGSKYNLANIPQRPYYDDGNGCIVVSSTWYYLCLPMELRKMLESEITVVPDREFDIGHGKPNKTEITLRFRDMYYQWFDFHNHVVSDHKNAYMIQLSEEEKKLLLQVSIYRSFNNCGLNDTVLYDLRHLKHRLTNLFGKLFVGGKQFFIRLSSRSNKKNGLISVRSIDDILHVLTYCGDYRHFYFINEDYSFP